MKTSSTFSLESPCFARLPVLGSEPDSLDGAIVHSSRSSESRSTFCLTHMKADKRDALARPKYWANVYGSLRHLREEIRKEKRKRSAIGDAKIIFPMSDLNTDNPLYKNSGY